MATYQVSTGLITSNGLIVISRIAAGLCDDGQVYNFFQIHLLHWLEALSLIGKTSRGIVIITQLERMLQVRHLTALQNNVTVSTDNYLQNDKHPSLIAMVQDAKRFILSNRSIIEEAPLQIYASALVFSPKQSLILSIRGQVVVSLDVDTAVGLLLSVFGCCDLLDGCHLLVPTSLSAVNIISDGV